MKISSPVHWLQIRGLLSAPPLLEGFFIDSSVELWYNLEHVQHIKETKTMKRIFLPFASGLFAMIVLMSVVLTAYAAHQKEATLQYSDIKITLDAVELVPMDASGKTIEPFAIDGTTYLPVRGVASALGLNVAWDGKTSTVLLTTPEAPNATYITRTGSKYHHDSTCNGGTYWEVPFASAIGMGLEPCEKCVN